MELLNRLRNALPRSRPAAVPVDPVLYQPIGVVRNAVRKSRPGGWEGTRSDLVFRDELVPALEGIEGFSHLVVIFHIDLVPDEARALQIAVGNEADPPLRGVLATRSQLRPNPIGVSAVRLVERRGNVLRVQGLDALDGTPVLDVKPYLPEYDAVADATLPPWAKRLPDSCAPSR